MHSLVLILLLPIPKTECIEKISVSDGHFDMYFFSKFCSWKRIAEQNNFVRLVSSNFRIWWKKFRVGVKIKGRSSNLNHTYFFSWPNLSTVEYATFDFKVFKTQQKSVISNFALRVWSDSIKCIIFLILFVKSYKRMRDKSLFVMT